MCVFYFLGNTEYAFGGKGCLCCGIILLDKKNCLCPAFHDTGNRLLAFDLPFSH